MKKFLMLLVLLATVACSAKTKPEDGSLIIPPNYNSRPAVTAQAN